MQKHLKLQTTQSDIDILLKILWQDDSHFYTFYMKIQCALILLICHITGEQIEIIVESLTAIESDKCLLWENIDFTITSNLDNPAYSNIFPTMYFYWIKSCCNDVSFYKKIIFNSEQPEICTFCLVLLLLSLAFKDNIFADVRASEQILKSNII